MRPGLRRDVRRVLRYAPAAVALGLASVLAVRITDLGVSEKVSVIALVLIFALVQVLLDRFSDAHQSDRADARRHGERPEDSYLPWYGVLATIAVVALLITGCLWVGFLTHRGS